LAPSGLTPLGHRLESRRVAPAAFLFTHTLSAESGSDDTSQRSTASIIQIDDQLKPKEEHAGLSVPLVRVSLGPRGGEGGPEIDQRRLDRHPRFSRGTSGSNPTCSSEGSAANSVRTRELSALPHRSSGESLSLQFKFVTAGRKQRRASRRGRQVVSTSSRSRSAGGETLVV
jgi:hypothetical protein